MPMTRWQGAMIEIGFLPFAAPTARTAAGIADLFGHLPIGARFAVGNREQRRPRTALEIGAAEFERHIERAARAGEVFAQLTRGLAQQRMARRFDGLLERSGVGFAAPDQRDQRVIGGGE